MWSYNYPDELYHHGIKGQKWGVRRYQNKDGSLTNAGKKRYSEDDRRKKYTNIDKKAFLKKLLKKTVKTVATLAALTLARKYLSKHLNKHVNKYIYNKMKEKKGKFNVDEWFDNFEPVIIPFEDK